MSVEKIQVELKRTTPGIQVEFSRPQSLGVEFARTITNYNTKPSTDPDNRSTLGSDGGIYTPEIAVDPLAYYILAKA